MSRYPQTRRGVSNLLSAVDAFQEIAAYNQMDFIDPKIGETMATEHYVKELAEQVSNRIGKVVDHEVCDGKAIFTCGENTEAFSLISVVTFSKEPFIGALCKLLGDEVYK